MAIIKTVWRAALNGSELCVVKEDQNPEVLFSINQEADGVTTRTTFRLSNEKASELAKILVGITTLGA